MEVMNMAKNLHQINPKAYVAWTHRLNPNTTFSQRGEPYCSTIDNFFKFEYPNVENKTARAYVTIQINDRLESYDIYIIKKGENYYIDLNSASFTNCGDDALKASILDHLNLR